MREKRGRRENRKTLDPVGEDGVTGKEGKGFFACYLLASLSPRHKGHTYIGFTVNPRRRIRQHNGEITSGAWRTKKKRPWEMVLCIYGFPTNVSALQFEWAWQHPRESLAVREAAAAFKSFSGLASKIKLVYTMLNLPAWNSLNLTVNYFSSKYAHHGGLSPSLPQHMKVEVCAMDDLPYFTKLDNSSQPEDEESPEGNEEEEDDSSNQSQPGNSSTSSSDDLYPGEKELHDQHFEKAKEPITVFDEDDRLANFSGFGLLEEETVEDEVSHSTVGSIEAMEKEPETVFLEEIVEDEVSHSTVGSIEAMEKEPETVFFEEIVEDEVSHSTVGSIEAMEKEPETVFLEEIVEDEVSHSTVGSIEAMEKEPETVFFEEIVEDEVSHGTVGSTEAMEKDCWRRRNLITSTTTTEAEVEVIDLMTPSPSCRVGSSMKRRRVSEFIDLTDLTMSPNFIEL